MGGTETAAAERAGRALVEAAHARGMKVYLDIVANHTADVIRYREAGADVALVGEALVTADPAVLIPEFTSVA
mgnify:CR=1 FL=1